MEYQKRNCEISLDEQIVLIETFASLTRDLPQQKFKAVLKTLKKLRDDQHPTDTTE
jgi:hypothetical protein